MKYYREMEMSSASPSNPNPTHSSSKPPQGNLSRLHHLASDSSGNREVTPNRMVIGHPNPLGAPRPLPHDITPLTTPSLFQRFSKTFSLRFGSHSNVNKVPGSNKQSKMGIGSSPDLPSDLPRSVKFFNP